MAAAVAVVPSDGAPIPSECAFSGVSGCHWAVSVVVVVSIRLGPSGRSVKSRQPVVKETAAMIAVIALNVRVFIVIPPCWG